MGIRFILIVNKQGQTKLSKYYFTPNAHATEERRHKSSKNEEPIISLSNPSLSSSSSSHHSSLEERIGTPVEGKEIKYEDRIALEGELSRKCLKRSEKQVSID